MSSFISDILLVEDIASTVEGLEIDLRSRRGRVFRLPDRERAARSLREDEWSLILFDLRIPDKEGGVERLEHGLGLIDDNISGLLGSINADTPFAIITQQAAVAEAEKFVDLPQCIGFFTKSEDPRRLFRTLEERGIIKASDLDLASEYREVRRRTKFRVSSVGGDGDIFIATVPAWGDEEIELMASDFLPSARRRIVSGPLPVFIYGTANVAASSIYSLEPADFEEAVIGDVPPLKLSRIDGPATP